MLILGERNQDFAVGGEALRSSVSIGPAPTGNVEGAPFIGSDGRVLGVAAFPDDDSASDLALYERMIGDGSLQLEA